MSGSIVVIDAEDVVARRDIELVMTSGDHLEGRSLAKARAADVELGNDRRADLTVCPGDKGRADVRRAGL